MSRGIWNYAGSVGSLAVGKFCPACYPLAAWVLTALGLGFMVETAVMKAVLLFFLAFGLLGLLRSGRTHGDKRPLIVAVPSAALLYAGRYVRPDETLLYAGIAGLAIAVVMDIRSARAAPPCAGCGESAPPPQGAKTHNEEEVKKMTAAKRKVEVFTAGCPLCDETVRLVRELACGDCEVTVYDLSQGCRSGECLDRARGYGITRVPSVVVDGRLAECCAGGAVTAEALKAAGVGAAP
ncbi:MAG TPA: MerC family mercury resistance protein [Deltaproteobacteria bacterium]|nr:MerC family mercury resistance protein [Deltaproteobacteria bacterium]